MGNGRSFSRNRKSAPGKSKRRARQRLNAAVDLQRQVDAAKKSLIDATQGAIEKAAESLAPVLAAATGVSEEFAKEAVLQVGGDEVVEELLRRAEAGDLEIGDE